MKKMLSVVGLLLCSHIASAGVIRSAVDATASSEYSSDYGIKYTIDQSGLSAGYTSGVDDFMTYLSTNPSHTLQAANFEWFSQYGVRSAVATYDLGSLYLLDAAALWAEEAWAPHTNVSFWVSENGVDYTSILSALSLVDNVGDYPASIFNFSAVNARYFQIAFGNCAVDGCSLGEIAFSTSAVVTQQPPSIPAPMPLTLVLMGLVGLWFARKPQSR